MRAAMVDVGFKAQRSANDCCAACAQADRGAAVDGGPAPSRSR
jgi:hypothetical protein